MSCSGDDDAAAPTTTTTTSTSTSNSSTTTSSTVAAGPQIKDATGTVRSWLTAVATGDDDTAIALLSQRSLDKIGGRAGFEKMSIELSEGWGAWGRASGVELTDHRIKFPTNVAIVVLHGSVSQEGPPRESWNAMPVVATADGDRVEPFLDLGAVHVDPAAGSKIADDQQLAAITESPSDTWFVLDDAEAFMPALKDVTEQGARWLSPPLKGIEPGVHSLAVVVVGDGIMARSFEYSG